MSYKITQIKLSIGKDSKYTYFGKLGCSRGCADGWFDHFVYGIKGIIGLQIYTGTGIFKDKKI